ncbi:MAG TPA: bifunctional serine/threonine-protein kinase/formylglycine-generating enzyme family protein, partial [Polyangiaceae bacterium]|nr:bifunctional serine/threonine-protein kinase/formylglycine-generating enzyme family protein [Polyangiaceae bacterium]
MGETLEDATSRAPGEPALPWPGAQIGQYRVVREIGRGGMGVVYEAAHVVIGQRAAVKVLRGLEGGSSQRRFLDEARALSLVEHPGVVRVFDFGRLEGGAPYILMELVEGEPLRARLSPAALGASAALRVARQIGAALAAAHARGIVHRDLKPDNVMLVRDDEVSGGERVKLLDFGIAKLADDGRQPTTDGMVLGTATYMAPEQCAGEPDVDDRADVYALGVVLYEMLTGAPPFRGEATAVMRQHLFQPPPPLRAPLPEGVRDIARRMLAKEPSRRPGMGEALGALQRLEREVAPGVASAAEVGPAPADVGAGSSAGGAAGEAEGARRAAGGAAGEAEGAGGAADAPATVVARPRAAAPGARRHDDPPGEARLADDDDAAIEARRSAPPRASRRARGWAIGGAALVAASAVAAWRGGALRRPATAPTLDGMVRLQGGRFTMGSKPEEIEFECAHDPKGCDANTRKRLERELPAHEVTLSPFQIDRYEVTHAQFADFLGRVVSSLDVREDRD